MVPEKAARYWENLEDYWPCAGGLSAVNVIGTQLRGLINSGSTPMTVGRIIKWTPPRNPVNKHQIQLSVENEEAGAG